MPENNHSYERDNRHDNKTDCNVLAAIADFAFDLGCIGLIIILLIHLAAYYTTTDCKFFEPKDSLNLV